MKLASCQCRNALDTDGGRVKSANGVSAAVFFKYSGKGQRNKNISKTDVRYWQQRLILRRYRFPAASGDLGHDWATLIDHAGTAYFFPLGTPVAKAAAAKARQIYLMAVKQGWNFVRRRFSRELTVSFEWCTNPVLWTYTTIHTLVGQLTKPEASSSLANPSWQRILVVETDAGIRRALCWSIDHQAGFASIPCKSVAAFARALELHKPRMVLLNRNLAGRIGFKSPGTISPIQVGVPALTYSVYVDGDQMFVSTAGGAEGYLVKRVKPDQLLEPILDVTHPMELTAINFLLRVKHYFQGLLQLHSIQENPAVAKLTRREREVLELLIKGSEDKQVAQSLGISIWTVHAHLKNIFKRLQVRTRTEAVIRYLEK